MKSRVICAIPVYNGEQFIQQTLESVAAQTQRPDRVVVLDNCSTDRTPEIVKNFRGLALEYVRNPTNLGLFGNFNRALELAPETDYLHILHADDLIEPRFYEVLTGLLEDCPGRGMAWCLDERIDENNRRLSVSGRPNGRVRVLAMDKFLRLKAEIGNQAFCATLLKTAYEPAPCKFRLDMPILGDMVFWAEWGTHCKKIVTVNLPLAKYRWHGRNETVSLAPNIQSLIVDEWRTMQICESLRGHRAGPVRWFKLKGLLAVRSGIKAKRFQQLGNPAYAREIVRVARGITGPVPWVLGQVLVQLRELLVYKLGGRPRHPKNVFS
ncbi:MAG: glycosyltransferase [Verrucomicrobiae bacterium]|nr:glycosyltransferase [Verrucomicrobiae bacterium]MDW7981066.1 glycosyltransferase family 2 protein [Verrucomicrobiales bacterium]